MIGMKNVRELSFLLSLLRKTIMQILFPEFSFLGLIFEQKRKSKEKRERVREIEIERT